MGIDGPLVANLGKALECRLCERLLLGGKFQKRCKPGQTSTPVGQQLHSAATKAAQHLLKEYTVARSELSPSITSYGVYEAFPSAFLGVMLPEEFWKRPSTMKLRRNEKSDAFWRECIRAGYLEAAVTATLGPSTIVPPVDDVSDHDERAAFVSALTAAAAHVGKYVAVGDPNLGYIYLPPLALWEQWARQAVSASLLRLRRKGSEAEVWVDRARVASL